MKVVLIALTTWLALPGSSYGQASRTDWLAGSTRAIASPAKALTVNAIHIVDEVEDGIRADVFSVSAEGKRELFATTDSEGKAVPNKSCPTGGLLEIIPKVVHGYLPIQPFKCLPPVIRHVLKLRRAAYLLLEKADREYALGNSRLAAMLYLDVADRLSSIDPETSLKAQIKGFRALKEPLNASGVYFIVDKDQEAAVLTKAGVQRVMDVQSKLGISSTGQLDYQTLAGIAGQDIGQHLKAAYSRAAKE